MILQVKKCPQTAPYLPVAFHHAIPTPSSQRRQPVETQNLASHEQPIATHIHSITSHINPRPHSRDAISCVSRAMTAYHHRHIITHTHCTYLLVRRKILRLYFCRLRYLIALKFPSAAYLMQSYTQSLLMPLQYYGYGLYFVERSEPVFLHLLKLRG